MPQSSRHSLDYANPTATAPAGPGAWRVVPLGISSAALLAGALFLVAILRWPDSDAGVVGTVLSILMLPVYVPFGIVCLAVSSAGKRPMVRDPLAWLSIAAPLLILGDIWLSLKVH